MHISHETIYKTLFIQARGALKKELLRQLRTQRVMRQSKYFNTKGNSRGGIIDAVSIHDRPPEMNDRMIPGHWEGDLICGTQKSYLATLVERSSRYTLLVKLSGNDTHTVVGAISQNSHRASSSTEKIINLGSRDGIIATQSGSICRKNQSIGLYSEAT
jgi:IS30 family transposase